MGEGDEGEGKVVGVVRAGEGVAGEKRLSASEGCMRGLRTLIGELLTPLSSQLCFAANKLEAQRSVRYLSHSRLQGKGGRVWPRLPISLYRERET